MFDDIEIHPDGVELGAADLAFARVVLAAATAPSDWLAFASALVSAVVQQGDVCVSLDTVLTSRADSVVSAETAPVDVAALRAMLLNSGVVQEAVEPLRLPLVLDAADRLYLARYWQDETRLAQALQARVADANTSTQAPPRAVLDALFPPSDHAPDWQRVAAVVASRQRLCVITGGPGTGKTRTVARLLAVLQSQSAAPLVMSLLAPTGKAAARLLESLQREVEALTDSGVPVTLPDTASTLHRALGYRHARRDFAHNSANPLPHDVVLVDEASMIDLSLMMALVGALRPDSRLILLGDRDQLASVDAGNVLGDIVSGGVSARYSQAQSETLAVCCDGFEAESFAEARMADAIVHLQHSYRFDAQSGIGVFANAVNNGRVDEALAALSSPQVGDISLTDPAQVTLDERLAQLAVAHFKTVLASANAEQALRCLTQFRVLCAMRSGPRGVTHINELVEQMLSRHGLIQHGKLWYLGRPILITQNNSGVGLYNGDMGVVWPDLSGVPLVWFYGDGGRVRSIAAGRLPAHQTCHAMTVHKTQGSEFDHVLMVLPDPPQTLLSRDLLYTGVTRARQRVEIYASEAAVQEGVLSKRVRVSGLQDLVWKPI